MPSWIDFRKNTTFSCKRKKCALFFNLREIRCDSNIKNLLNLCQSKLLTCYILNITHFLSKKICLHIDITDSLTGCECKNKIAKKVNNHPLEISNVIGKLLILFFFLHTTFFILTKLTKDKLQTHLLYSCGISPLSFGSFFSSSYYLELLSVDRTFWVAFANTNWLGKL